MNLEISVFPAHALSERKRLFQALERAFSVTFVGYSDRADSVVPAAIFFGEPGTNAIERMQLSALRLPGGMENGFVNNATIRVADDDRVDRAFRGRNLSERRLGACDPLPVGAGTTLLASADSRPIWCFQENNHGGTWVSALPVHELDEGECLRDRFRAGSFAALLPLVHFLKDVCAKTGWTEPPLRAAFIMDDPNLHSLRYGYLRFPDLARHANEHNYHVAMATIPLDAWFTHRGAAEVFRSGSARLSLLIHGNNHLHHELDTFGSQGEALSCLAQALRRARRFEERTGVAVSTVIAPPHGACSELAITTMLRLGYEGICVSRPFPWLKGPPSDMPLAGWLPADLVAGGLPVIPRYHLSAPREDLVFRAFLRQPLILYGHHDDASSGLQVFSTAAEQIGSFGEVRWGSLEQIARSNFATRRDAACLHIRSYSNNFNLDVPDDVSEIALSTPPVHGCVEDFTVAINGSDVSVTSTDNETGCIQARFPAIAGKVSISLRHRSSITAVSVPAPPWQAWSMVRRILTESRDRVRPLMP